MGTRLYPSTDNEQLLEMFAEVPAGTTAVLKALESSESDGYKQYKAVQANENAAKLHCFQLYGWGRVAYVPSNHDVTCGDTSDEAEIRAMASMQGIKPHLVDELVKCGVAWC